MAPEAQRQQEASAARARFAIAIEGNRFSLAYPRVFGYRADVTYEGNFVSFFAAGLIALPVLAFLSAYVYVGVGFWRLHRDDFTRLSVYILTHQPGLIANFAASRPRLLERMNSLALDALSFQRLTKVVLLWPLFVPRFRQVLEFARFSSRILGDERTDALADRMREMGLVQADEDDVKSGERFRDGFLVRRLDDELVAIFWHEVSAESGAGGGAPLVRPAGFSRKVVPLRVPAERRVHSIARTFQKWGFYTHVAEGLARDRGKALPYVVVYEPFSLGTAPAASAFAGLIRSDVRRLWARFTGTVETRAPNAFDRIDAFEAYSFGVDGRAPGYGHGPGGASAQDEKTTAMRAETAYLRFLNSTLRPAPSESNH